MRDDYQHRAYILALKALERGKSALACALWEASGQTGLILE